MSQKRQSTTNNDTDGESRKKVCLLSRCISSDATNDSACFECTDAASSSNADDSTGNLIFGNLRWNLEVKSEIDKSHFSLWMATAVSKKSRK